MWEGNPGWQNRTATNAGRPSPNSPRAQRPELLLAHAQGITIGVLFFVHAEFVDADVDTVVEHAPVFAVSVVAGYYCRRIAGGAT